MSSTVLGVVVLTRHGDRSGFYQSPVSYTPSNTEITPLGEVQEYQLGGLLRSRYLEPSSPQYIAGINASFFQNSQIQVKADAGGEGTVISDSAQALTQGLFPPNSASSTTLANGTTIVSPLNGWQYVQVQTVEPEEDISLEGWTQCNTFTESNSALYNSSAFTQVASDNAAFLESLVPIVGNRNVTLANFYNVWDFINVQSIHNATFLASVNAQVLEQTRALANYHENAIFSNPDLGAIENIAGQTILPNILTALSGFSNSTNPLKMVELSISYKPFISLFKMTNVSDTNPQLRGIVDYASALAFELRESSLGSGELTVHLSFKNGSADFVDYNMFGLDSDPTWSQFNSTLAPYAINDLSDWCSKCANTATRGCATIAAAERTFSNNEASTGQSLSPLAAGLIGWGVTFGVMLAAFLLLLVTGVISFGAAKKSKRSTSKHYTDKQVY